MGLHNMIRESFAQDETGPDSLHNRGLSATRESTRGEKKYRKIQ